MTPSIFIKKKIAVKYGGLGKVKQGASDYRLWLKINRKHKPKIFLINLSKIMLNEATVTGNFELSRYVFQTKEMLKYTNMNFIGKTIIIIVMIITIIYNFFAKNFFLK